MTLVERHEVSTLLVVLGTLLVVICVTGGDDGLTPI
jgi:hypothetical protein